MDPIVIRIQADVRAAVNEIAELRQKYSEFSKQWIQSVRIAGQATVNLAGDKLIAQANAYVKVVERIGGANKLTQAEQVKVNNLLTEAIAKYEALGEKAPKAFAKLVEETAKARKTPFISEKAIKDAERYAQEIAHVGGAIKLTAAEQVKANKVVQEAISKYQAMGQKVPVELAKLGQQLKELAGQRVFTDKSVLEAQRVAQEIGKLGGAIRLTVAEQQKANKAISEGIEKYKVLGQAVPQELSKVQRELKKLADARVFGDQSIQAALRLVDGVRELGGVSRLTGAEMAKVNKVLTEAMNKYRALGEQAPVAMQRLLAATTKVAQTPIFGEGTIKKAEQVVAQIQRAGGHATLTAAEQQKVNKLLTEAIEKYTLLGRVVPKALQDIATATSKISRNQQLLGPLAGEAAINKAKEYVRAVQAIGGVTKLTVREQERFNKVLGEAIEKLARMGKAVPDTWRQLYNQTKTGTTQVSRFFDQLFFKIAGGATVAQLVSNAIDTAFRAVANSIRAATNAVVELIRRGSELQNLRVAFEGLATDIGIVPEDLLQRTREMTRGLVSDFDIMASANRAMLFGLKLTAQEFAEMTEAGIILGRAMNLGPEQSVQRLILALGRMSPRILDDLGIIVKLAEANEKWAAAHGKTVRQMTGSEKVLAFQEAAMIKIREAMQNVGEIQLTLQDRITQLQVSWTNWTNQLATSIVQSGVLHRALIGLGEAFQAAFGPNNADLIRVITRLLEEIAIVLVDLTALAVGFAAEWADVFRRAAQDLLAFWNTLEMVFNLWVTTTTSIAMGLSQIPGASFLPQVQSINLLATALLAAKQNIDAFGKAYKPIIEGAMIESGQFADRLRTLSERLHQVANDMRRARGQQVIPTPAIGGAPFEIEPPPDDTGYDDAVESLQKRMAKLNVILESAFKQNVRNEDIIKRHGAAIRALRIEAEELGVAMPAALAKASEIVRNWDLAKLIHEANVEFQNFISERNAAALRQMFQDGQENANAFLENVNAMSEAVGDLFVSQAKSERDLLNVKLRNIQQEATKRRLMVNRNSSLAKEALQSIADWEIAEMERVTREYEMELASRELAREGWYTSFADIFEGIPQLILDAFTGGGEMAGAWKAIGGLIGQTIGKQLFTEGALPNMISQGLSKLFGTDFAASIAPMLGQMGGAIGTFAAEGVSRLVKWLHKTTQEKIMEDVGRDWGVQISEGLADEIKKKVDELKGDRQAATLYHIAEIIEEAGGITAANVGIWTARIRDLFVMLAEGRLTITDVASTMEKVFPMLLEQIDKTTGLARADLVELIALSKQMGVEVAAITEFILEQTEKVLEGFNAIAVGVTADWLHPEETEKGKKSLKELGDEAKELAKKIADLEAKPFLSGAQRVALRDYRKELAEIQKDIQKRKDEITGARDEMAKSGKFTQEDFNRYARLAVVAFDAAIASGMNILKVIEEMGPGLDELTLASETLGFRQEEAFGDLVAIRNWAREHEKAAKAIGGINDMAVGLYNTNKLSQETFTDLGTTAVEMFEKMTAEGLTSNQAMKTLQPTLQILWELQKRNNYTLDEATQKLVDRAEAEGKVGKQFMSNEARIADATQQMADAMKELLKALGIELPDSMKEVEKSADGIKDGLGKVDQTLIDQQELWDAWSRNAVHRIQEVQDEVNALNFGGSPGGLKEIPIKLDESTAAVEEFGLVAKDQFGELYDELTGLPWKRGPWEMPPMCTCDEFVGGDVRDRFPDIKTIEDFMKYLEGIDHGYLMDGQPWRRPGGPGSPEDILRPTESIVVMPGAVNISTWTIEETEKIEKIVTQAVLRGITRNDEGSYSHIQNLVRSMMHGY